MDCSTIILVYARFNFKHKVFPFTKKLLLVISVLLKKLHAIDLPNYNEGHSERSEAKLCQRTKCTVQCSAEVHIMLNIDDYMTICEA